MKLWISLVILLHIWRKTSATPNVEDTTNESNLTEYSPQFLRGDELSVQSSIDTTETSKETVKNFSLETEYLNSTTQRIELIILNNDTTTSVPETKTELITQFDELTTESNLNDSRSFKMLKIDYNTSSNNIKMQTVKETDLNNDKLSEHIEKHRLKHNVQNSINKTNISVVYSIPYQPGKDLYNNEKTTVVYPEINTDINESPEIKNASFHEVNNQTIFGDEQQDKTNQTSLKTTSIQEEAVNERVKQIRHDLYKRRPMTHYLIKIKNDKSTNITDVLTNNSSNHVQDTTIKPVNVLNKMKIENLELNDSMVEMVDKTRKRNGLTSKHYLQNIDQTNNTHVIQKEVVDLTNKTENLSTNKNISLNNDNLDVSESKLLTSIIYHETDNSNDMNAHPDNAPNIPQEANDTKQTTNHKTGKPFRPSPEFNPEQIHVYDMNYRLRSVLPNNENTQLNSYKTTHIEPTTKRTISKSVMENIMVMLKNLRRLPSKEHKKINIENTPHNFNSDNINIEQTVENYESKKIRPLQMNRVQGSQIPIERKQDRMPINQHAFTTLRRTQKVTKPRPMSVLSEPSGMTMLSSTNKKLNVDKTTQKIESTARKPLSIEQIVKTNILMDFEKIKLMMLQINQHNQSLNQLQNKTINNLQNNQQTVNPINQEAHPTKQPNNSLQTNLAAKPLSYLRNRTNKISREKTSNRKIPVRNTEINNLNGGKRRNNDQINKEKKGSNDSIPRNNYRRRPISRGNRYFNQEKNTTSEMSIEQSTSVGNKTEINNHLSSNNIKETLNSRRRSRYKNRRNQNKQSMKTLIPEENLNFFNNEYENVHSTTISYEIIAPNLKNTTSEKTFSNTEIELRASSSERNATIEKLTSNETINAENKQITNSSQTKDLVSSESRRNEKSVFTDSFVAPAGFENGFIPMVFDVGGTIIGPVPRALKIENHNSIPQLKLPASVDQIQDLNIVSPNLMTSYGDIGRIPQSDNQNMEREVKENGNEQNKNIETGNDSEHYETALKHYNEALRKYNNYLQQFIHSQKQM